MPFLRHCGSLSPTMQKAMGNFYLYLSYAFILSPVFQKENIWLRILFVPRLQIETSHPCLSAYSWYASCQREMIFNNQIWKWLWFTGTARMTLSQGKVRKSSFKLLWQLFLSDMSAIITPFWIMTINHCAKFERSWRPSGHMTSKFRRTTVRHFDVICPLNLSRKSFHFTCWRLHCWRCLLFLCRWRVN